MLRILPSQHTHSFFYDVLQIIGPYRGLVVFPGHEHNLLCANPFPGWATRPGAEAQGAGPAAWKLAVESYGCVVQGWF